MKLVLEVSRMLAVTTDLDPLLARIAEAATGLLNAERASIFLHDPKTDELWTKVALQSSEIRVPAGSGIVGVAFKQNQVVHVHDPYEDPRFNQAIDQRTGFRTRNLLSAPMVDLDRRPLGVIQVINKGGGGFVEGDHALIQMLADQAGVAIQRYRLQLEAMDAVAMRREMDLAKRVQEAMLPKSAPAVPGVDAVGWTRPASTTGGDAFDLWKMPDGRLGIFVADATGHGLAPALVVSQARTLVRALSDTEPDAHNILARINTRLSEDLEMGRFVTAFIGLLSPDGTLAWSSAGHGPNFLRKSRDASLVMLDPPVQPLGIVPVWDERPDSPVKLAAGGSLVLISDGIFEAANPAGEQFEVPRVQKMLDENRDRSSGEIVAMLRDAVREWQQKDDPADDQTIVVVQRA